MEAMSSSRGPGGQGRESCVVNRRYLKLACRLDCRANALGLYAWRLWERGDINGALAAQSQRDRLISRRDRIYHFLFGL